MHDMISYNAALDLMLEAAAALPTERVALRESLNRVLAEDILSDTDMPPFNKSAMDGYACRRADLSTPLTLIEEVPAGKLPTKSIGPGQCAKIMTGAPVPEGADCVIMVEYTQQDGDTVTFTAEKTADNICLKGEDVRTGDTVLARGQLIGAAHIAVLASVGATRPLVSARPKVGVIATGDELVEPDTPLDGACIRNSNSYQICAQLQEIGATPTYYGIVGDDREPLTATVAKAKSENDVIVLSGGVSMGDYDLVPEILKNAGFGFKFESIAMKPGRPTVFGQDQDKYCCGLPGNPVSTFVVFEILLKPFLYRLMGYRYEPVPVQATLADDVRRKKASRQSTLPVRFTEAGIAAPLEYHGSAHINAIPEAHGLVTIPVGKRELPKGSIVHVRPL